MKILICEQLKTSIKKCNFSFFNYNNNNNISLCYLNFWYELIFYSSFELKGEQVFVCMNDRLYYGTVCNIYEITFSSTTCLDIYYFRWCLLFFNVCVFRFLSGLWFVIWWLVIKQLFTFIFWFPDALIILIIPWS